MGGTIGRERCVKTSGDFLSDNSASPVDTNCLEYSLLLRVGVTIGSGFCKDDLAKVLGINCWGLAEARVGVGSSLE